jgi:hypothetical protein
MTGLVARFATGYLETEIYRDRGAYLWVRRAGPDRDEPFRAVSPRIAEAIAAVPTGPVAWCLPESDSPVRRYRAPGARPVADIALTQESPAVSERLYGMLRNTGRALRAVHDALTPEPTAEPPPGPSRLATWMAGGLGSAAAARLREAALRRLGDRRWERVRSWNKTNGSADRFLHGAPGLGGIVPGRDLDAGVLLSGEELARGPAELDVGWLLGDLAELRALGTAIPALAWMSDRATAGTSAVLDGYGPGLDPAALGRVATQRVFTHVHDFAAFVGWQDQLLVYLDLLAGLIDDQDG